MVPGGVPLGGRNPKFAREFKKIGSAGHNRAVALNPKDDGVPLAHAQRFTNGFGNCHLAF